MDTLTAPILRVAAGALVVLVVLGLCLHIRRRRRVAQRLGDPSLVRELLDEDLRRIPWPRYATVSAAALLIGLSLLDPSLRADRDGSRGPIVLILDASGSMLVDDVGPPRLELQRAVAEEFVSLVSDLPVGVVAFAGRAFSLTPPTRDRNAVRMYLATLDPTIVSQTGSALGAAIRQGVSLLAAADVEGGTIILFGDGDETDDDAAAREAASLAGRNGIAIHVVGVGTEQGGPVPALDLTTGVTSGYLRDPAGEIRFSRLGSDLLHDIASLSAGGSYLSGESPDVAHRLVTAAGGGAATSRTGRLALPFYASVAIGAFLLLMAEPLTRRLRPL